MPPETRKRFGQNFLHDAGIIHRMLAAINARPGQHIIEIGPGRGAITKGLVASGATISAVEIDRDLAQGLSTAFAGCDNFRLITADALSLNISELGTAPVRIVGNLPYNISTPLLFHLFSFGNHISDMVFMLQKEVVERLTASPNTRAYGRLSIMAQYHCRARKLLDVTPGCFRPAPKVQSAVVQLQVRDFAAQANNVATLQCVVATAFQQRRKTLSNALKSLMTANQLVVAGINPKARPDTLTIADYIRLANLLDTTA